METMIRPYRAAKTTPTVAVETRVREVEQESPRVSERDLRNRLALILCGETGGALEKEVPEDGDDARTLPLEVDVSGRRCWSWRSAVNCSSTYGQGAEDFEGPPSVLRLKYFLQHGGDPRLWLQQW